MRAWKLQQATDSPSLRGGEADAAIQFHPLTASPPRRQRTEPNLWIAASAAPPRNDVRAGECLGGSTSAVVLRPPVDKGGCPPGVCQQGMLTTGLLTD
jgi:hypothetical protein